MDIYLENLQIPVLVKETVMDYLEFLYKQEKNRDINLEKNMRDKLPEDLRYELVSAAYAKMN